MVDMLYRTGVLDWMTGYALQTEALAQADLTRYLALGEQWSTIRALNLVGAAMSAQGEMAEARRIYQAALALARENAIVPAALDALLGIALVLRKEGQIAPAFVLLTQVAQHPESAPETKERATEMRDLLAEQLSPTEIATLRSNLQSPDEVFDQF
jgi:ATP/maltotriose-dependent transcriptional regulator MalT